MNDRAEIDDAAPGRDDDAPQLACDFVEDGVTVTILKRAEFGFDARASTTQTGVLAYGVDASEWASGQLLVLTHARNDWITLRGDTASFFVEVHSVRLDEDSDLEFVDSVRAVAVQLAVHATSDVPGYGLVPFTAPFGPNLRVRWVYNQGITEPVANLTLAVSIYLVGRRH